MRTVSFVSVLFCALSVSAQNTENRNVTVSATPPSTVPVAAARPSNVPLTATEPSTVALTQRSTDPANPTPEQQGYTKKIIGGKEVYVKETGQMTFYYEPKK